MKYSHIICKLREPCLVTPQRHAAICELLESRLQNPEPAMPEREHEPERDDPEPMMDGSTAIIPVHGTLVRHPEDIAMSECGCDLETLGNMIDAAESEPSITRVVYDFRTPGGSVVGIPETGRKIRDSQKETVAFTASECCSGGIWLAEQCQQFYATESARVGSVGVYCLMFDESGMMEKLGVKANAFSAGKYKLLGAYWKPMTDEEKAIVQARVDKIYDQFKEAMVSYRTPSDKNFGNGLVFDGEEAAQIGFTDGVVESLEEVLAMPISQGVLTPI